MFSLVPLTKHVLYYQNTEMMLYQASVEGQGERERERKDAVLKNLCLWFNKY
jgi:hypothetical protein